MSQELDVAVRAMRAEFRRQAEAGEAAAYHGVSAEGLDGLEGYFDLTAVALAALSTLRPAPATRPL